MSVILYGLVAMILVTMGVGLYVAKKIEGDSVNYIVAGRGLVLPLAAATLMAQSLDANATLGNTDLTASFGFWAGAALPIGLAGCLFLTGLFFAKPMNRMDLMTLPDFYRRKYGRVTEVIASLIMVLSFSLLLGGNLVAGGFLFQTFMGTTFVQGVLIISAVVFLYTIAGGLFAVAYTDVIQAVVALAGSIALIVYVATTYGITIPEGMGPTAVVQINPFDNSAGSWINLATIFALALGDIVAIDFMERVFAAESPETAQKACFAGSAGTLVIGIPFSIVALSANSILSSIGVEAGNQAVLYVLLQEAVPSWLAVLVLAGIVAASLSTGDGAILGTSAALARNVLGIRDEDSPGEGVEADGSGYLSEGSDKLLAATRVMAVPITILGAFFAIQVSATGMLLVLAFDVAFAGLLVPLVFGIYKPDVATAPAALAGMLSGSLTRLFFFVTIPTTYAIPNNLLYVENSLVPAGWDGLVTFIAPLVGLSVFLTVAFLTKDDYPTHSVTGQQQRAIVAGGEEDD
ncbi:sodium:solute symporter family protein [Haloarcula sp. JP-L23]|uniref:sodium:solute symporter family protein n=1 Tax=Haloarcula sp. JP-L23 TaxID=2716717 RepID=UPI00140EF6D8|nr:sodium:solute symporter [Haloarcula sp. JP-L23]